MGRYQPGPANPHRPNHWCRPGSCGSGMDLAGYAGNHFRECPQGHCACAGGHSGDGVHRQGRRRSGPPFPDGDIPVHCEHPGRRAGGGGGQHLLPRNPSIAGCGRGKRSQRPHGRVHQPPHQHGCQSAGFHGIGQLYRYPVLGRSAGTGPQEAGLAGHHQGDIGPGRCNGAGGQVGHSVCAFRYPGPGVLGRVRKRAGDFLHLRKAHPPACGLHAFQYACAQPSVVLHRHPEEPLSAPLDLPQGERSPGIFHPFIGR